MAGSDAFLMGGKEEEEEKVDTQKAVVDRNFFGLTELQCSED